VMRCALRRVCRLDMTKLSHDPATVIWVTPIRTACC
jgi:hypothetical protein